MREPLILYSTNTWLAYRIAQAYYDEKHYVWCTPYFSPDSSVGYDHTVPPSSSPSELYDSLHEDVARGDRHSTKVEMNKAGILKGAIAKERVGAINKKQRLEIYAIVRRAEMRDFRPLLYVIPFQPIAKLVKEVPIEERAHPLSEEYKIELLPRKYFDIVELHRGQK
ncbi:MAG: hypothetical protein ABW007_22080 [Chitinophagaceae bacterium]